MGDYSYEQLLEHADLALYRAKIEGRNQYAVGEKLIPLDTGNKGETAVKLLMDETMEKREFEIYFQPKISLHNYKIVGAEALVRWRRPDGIVVRPEHFLPFYEKNGKIVELDFYVFEQVAAFLEKTKRSGITPGAGFGQCIGAACGRSTDNQTVSGDSGKYKVIPEDAGDGTEGDGYDPV